LRSYFSNNSMEDNIINVTVVDREGIEHPLLAPTDMAMNMMEVCKSYDLPVEGTCGGMALCASCHMYILSDHTLSEEIDGLRVQLAPVGAE
jgi:ferredoxin